MAHQFKPSRYSVVARNNRGSSTSWSYQNQNYYIVSDPLELKVDDWGIGADYNTTVFNGLTVANGWTIDDVITILGRAPTSQPFWARGISDYSAALQRLKEAAQYVKTTGAGTDLTAPPQEGPDAPDAPEGETDEDKKSEDDSDKKFYQQPWFPPVVVGGVLLLTGLSAYAYMRNKKKS